MAQRIVGVGMAGRVMALGPAHLAKVARVVELGPQNPRFRPLSEDDFADHAARLVAELDGAPFWIFAYGSLIWNPAFDYSESCRGTVHGWRRSFCIHITNWRGTPETPGLMMGLTRGGACTGVAYRMPDDDRYGRMLRLLRREVSVHEDMPWLRWVSVRSRGRQFRALTFYCTPPGDPDAVMLPIDEQVARLARAVGFKGSCAEYLYNTVSHLEALGIRDRYLWDLQARVAAEIDRL